MPLAIFKTPVCPGSAIWVWVEADSTLKSVLFLSHLIHLQAQVVSHLPEQGLVVLQVVRRAGTEGPSDCLVGMTRSTEPVDGGLVPPPLGRMGKV